ncbi:alpha/beta hydrolase [Arthrobacter echini]|uniref:Alpha/beta hydrolase n=1 Tax=Arthrobacter echini TaxID=1529066 RepID=A0A4S5EA11_9MICC|nr:alpha/beta fold hydrolase [Arthrobacter echini]THJ68577.1 alpha/beta hydrolase [Arthrobacter echini]
MATLGGSDSGPDITVQRIHRNDLWARATSVGDPGERAFVLVPGIGVSSHYFEQLAPHLRQFGPVYALDLPGFGGVPHARKALSIREFAELVSAAIDELGLDDPIVVGHSMGAQICAELAAIRPGLSSLVLISPVIDASARSVPVQALRFVHSSLHEPFRVTFLAVVAYLTCGFDWFFKILPQMMTYPIERAAPQVTTSTLIIRGELDAVCPRPWVAALGELFSDSAVVEIEGAAHSVMHAHAREVAALCVRHTTGHLADHHAVSYGAGADRADGGGIAVVPELPREHSSLGLGGVIRALATEFHGIAVEFKGNKTDDDHLVEQGREQQAEARGRGRS